MLLVEIYAGKQLFSLRFFRNERGNIGHCCNQSQICKNQGLVFKIVTTVYLSLVIQGGMRYNILGVWIEPSV